MNCERYEIVFTKQAQKDIAKLTPKLKAKFKDIIRNKVSVAPENGKQLASDLSGYYFCAFKFSRSHCLPYQK